jgi:preprotein translocase subunit SecF
MKLIKEKLNIDFMGKWKLAAIFSVTLIVASIASLATQGLNLGVDFTGGTLIEVGYQEAVELESVRAVLAASEFGEATIQYFGSASDVLIRVAPREGVNTADISQAILDLLKVSGQTIDLRRVEFVGPQVGEELSEDGGLAMPY